MSNKFLLLLVVLAVASCYGIPINVQPGDMVLNRFIRSPQRRIEARGDHNRSTGWTSSVNYHHPINKNWEAYASARRNEKFNDNSAHAGLAFKF
uniref:Attacin C-terminal domain-containing protein n=1 Tax=Eristalis tenax TaxID=198635 RepID=A4VBB9_ERITN|nr:hypothetical protein [Eristalis tenax]